MKILYMVEATGAGVGAHVIELANLLHSSGHEVHMIYSPIRMDKMFEIGSQKLEGIQTCSIPMRRSIHIADILSIIRIVRYIISHGPFDVLHGHSSKAGALARLVAFLSAGTRIYTPHAFVTMDPTLRSGRRTVYGIIERLLAIVATDKIIVMSEDELQHALSLGISSNKLVIVTPGVSLANIPSKEAIRSSLGLDSDDVCVGWVGRYVPQKAVERLIKSFAQIAPGCPKLKLLLLGEGPLEAEMRDLVAELSIEDRVLWLKHVPGREIIASFDVFVLTSRYEGMPRVILEAMAAGVPVVAMQSGGVTSVVRSGLDGYVVPAGDMTGLTEKLRLVTSNLELRRRMSIAIKEQAKRFSMEAMCHGTLEVYRLSISNNRRAIDRVRTMFDRRTP